MSSKWSKYFSNCLIGTVIWGAATYFVLTHEPTFANEKINALLSKGRNWYIGAGWVAVVTGYIRGFFRTLNDSDDITENRH